MRVGSVMAAAMLSFVPVAGAGDVADAHALVSRARQRVEATDSRATGRLVRVDASGKRTSQSFVIKAHWFPGVLRVLLELMPAAAQGTPAGDPQGMASDGSPDARRSVLFEMRPEGQSTIRIFLPKAAAPTQLPFDRWGEGVAGTDFDYEDFLQPELYWHDQTPGKSETVGGHVCDELKSAPGPADRSHYAEVDTCFDQATGYPLHVVKTSKGAGAVKDFMSLGLTQSGGVWAARQVEVKVQGRAGSTVLLFERGSAKAHLSAKDFSPEQVGRFEDHP